MVMSTMTATAEEKVHKWYLYSGIITKIVIYLALLWKYSDMKARCI